MKTIGPKYDGVVLLVYSLSSLVMVVGAAGWITHIRVCLQNEQYLLLVAGAIAAPVGSVHGIGCWFGWW